MAARCAIRATHFAAGESPVPIGNGDGEEPNPATNNNDANPAATEVRMMCGALAFL